VVGRAGGMHLFNERICIYILLIFFMERISLFVMGRAAESRMAEYV